MPSRPTDPARRTAKAGTVLGIAALVSIALAVLLWEGYAKPDAPAPHTPLWIILLLPGSAGVASSRIATRPRTLAALLSGATTVAIVTVARLIQVAPDVCVGSALRDEVPSAIMMGFVGGVAMSVGMLLGGRIAASTLPWGRVLAVVAGIPITAVAMIICAILGYRECR